MKALEILEEIRNIETEYNHRKEHRFDKAINELEQIQDRILQLEIDETDKIVQDIMLEKDEALAIERLMYKKLLEKNKELSDQIALNNPFKNRSCDNCKKGFDCSIFKRLWKEKLRKEGYLMSRKEFDCRFWESINENT